MADIFLSYAREDRDIAQRLASAIEAAGKSVWWDRHIKGGAEFSVDIEKQLKAAGQILVLWSENSVHSRWVRDEATEAADSHRMISATIDGTPPPLGFRQFHCVDLQEWTHTGAALPEALAEAIDAEAVTPIPVSTPSRPETGSRRTLLIAAMVAVTLIVGIIATVRPGPIADWLGGEEEHQGAAIAILPFTVSGDEELAYLGRGLPITLTDGLARLPDLSLTSTTSTQAVVDQGLGATAIGEALGVSHFVEGDIRATGDRLTATLRLIDASTARQVWSETVTGSRANIADFERRIGNYLAAAVKAQLGIADGSFISHEGIDPRAYEAYVRGLEQLSVRFERDARIETLRQFRLAAEIDPQFADAHAGVAYILALSTPVHFPLTLDQIIAQQKAANDRALELDPDNVMALVARSTAAHNYFGDIDKSMTFARRALEIDPDFGPAHYSLGTSYVMAGEPEKSLSHFDRAVANDPFNVVLRIYRMLAYHALHDYQSVRDEILECAAPCTQGAFNWYDALIRYGTRQDFEHDWGRIMELMGTDVSENNKADLLTGARYYLFGEPGRFIVDYSGETGLPLAADLAHLGYVDEAFEVANREVENQQADNILWWLMDDRAVLPEKVRADPRYHEFLAIPRYKAVADYRKAKGITSGLPVFPVKAYEPD